MKRRRKDSGFAMLMVFLLAACVAITLYVEIPRVAFEAERQREMLVVDRGNQFKRAIQVFVTDRVNNPTRRYPASIEELESFNNHRYLRRRYVDPMTGKDEWRLVHINGGILTDSVTTQAKPGGTQGGSETTSTYLTQQTYLSDVGGGGNAGAGGVQRALNRRPSDTEGAPGSTGAPGGLPGATGDPNSPAGANGSPPIPPGLPGSPGANGQPIPPGLPGSPSTTQSTGQQQPQQPCNVYIGSCAPTTPAGNPAGQQAGQPGVLGNGATPGGGVPGGPGFNTPGGGNGNGQQTAQQSASAMINNLLTTPRPGGMPSNMPGSTIGGGVAGVASKYEAEGIMVINQRTKINEWEYIFDANKWRAPPNPVAGAAGTPIGQNGMNGPGINNGTPTNPQQQAPGTVNMGNGMGGGTGKQ